MSSPLQAQIRPPNYDEAAMPAYTLPDVLVGADGTRVADRKQWPAQRQYLVEQLAAHEFGVMPTDLPTIQVETIESGEFEGSRSTSTKIRRKQLAVTLTRNDRSVTIDLLVFAPAAKGTWPCFVGLNFEGNQSITDDPNVRITKSWCGANGKGVVNNRATEASRGSEMSRLPVEAIVAGGFAVATAYYGDIDPDYDDGFENGVHALYPEFRCNEQHPERWGSIAAWAWGLSRIADVLENEPNIARGGLMVYGHSRLGKAALWAGANDQRFQFVISNNSGCGGAALSKRVFGESVARINTSFPHWFNRNFRLYNDAEEKLPVDQHMLIAAVAPRNVYITSATEDQWADPKGELLGGHYASPAYELHGEKGLIETELPPPNTPIGGSIGYHIREGKHELTSYDWEQFIRFAKQIFDNYRD